MAGYQAKHEFRQYVNRFDTMPDHGRETDVQKYLRQHIVALGYSCRIPVFANFTRDVKKLFQIFKLQTIFYNLISLCDITTLYVSW